MRFILGHGFEGFRLEWVYPTLTQPRAGLSTLCMCVGQNVLSGLLTHNSFGNASVVVGVCVW